MRYLVLNAGSTSIKYVLYSAVGEVVDRGAFENISSSDYKSLTKEVLGKFKGVEVVVGHRVVHGGGKYCAPIVLSEEVIKDLRKYCELAPLHQSYELDVAQAAMNVLNKAKHVAVFDTEFYKDLSDVAKTYAINPALTERYGIERFGFHGLSHEYVLQTIGEKKKIISCHLGGGSSITAIDDGRVVDTSMGFTPSEGVVMATRSGTIDPGIVWYLSKNGVDVEKELLLNSGLVGLTGIKDVKIIADKAEKGDNKCKNALEIFSYSIKKYIGAYYAIMGGCDVLAFTGTIGYRNSFIRSLITNSLSNNILAKTKIEIIKPDEEAIVFQKIKKI